MSEKEQQAAELALESVITSAIQIPGVKVSRSKFLAETFAADQSLAIQDIIDMGPVQAGVSREKLASIANKLILTRTSQSSIASFVSGIPGGLAMAATVPADVLQFFGMALRLAQELSYLYGAEDIWKGETVDEERVKGQLVLYCGVMFGVSGAVSGVRVLSAQIAKTTLKKLPQKALTKTFWYPIIKKVGRAVGVKITKSTVAKGASKAIPVIGGAISGTLNFASMMPMANRLQAVLDKAAFNYTVEELEADIIDIENCSFDEEQTDSTTKFDASVISGTVNSGFKSAKAGLSGLLGKKKTVQVESAPGADGNLNKIKQLKELLDMGAITQEEYDAKKREYLGL